MVTTLAAADNTPDQLSATEVELMIASGQPMSEEGKIALRRIVAAMGMELRFCRLRSCPRPFIPKRGDQVYCMPAHAEDDWNKYRRFGM